MQRALHPDGNRIRTLRVQRGWPQEQLAQVADLSPRTIQRVEAGGNVSYETLRSIACAFEVEAKELLKEQPAAAAPHLPETTGHEAEIVEADMAMPIRVANNNRMLRIMSRSMWAAVLATAIAFLGYLPQFISRSPTSEDTTVASNSSQAPSSVSLAGERLPALERQVGIVPNSLAVEKQPQRQHRKTQTAKCSSVPKQVMDIPLPNLPPRLAVSALGGSKSWLLAPHPNEQLVEELAVTHPIVSTAECKEMVPQPAAGLGPQSKKVADSGDRSLSDAAVRFSKRTSGFFSRLGAAMKTSF